MRFTHRANFRSGEGRKLDLPRYDVRYIIDRKRRNRSRRRSSSFESISGRKRGRSSSRGRRHCSSSSSDSSPSLPSQSVVTTSERKKVKSMSKSARRRRRRSRASNSPDLGRGLRHDVGHRRSMSPLPRRRKRSTLGSEDNTVVVRHSPSVSRGTKGRRKYAVRSGSNDSEIIILPKKKSNKILRTSELISKKTGKREKITTSNACGAVGSKNKKSKKKTASKQIDITSAAAAASSGSASAVAGKEVYAAGNKILVSVNFKHSATSRKKAKKRPSNDSGDGCENKSPQHKPDSSSSAAVERAKAKKPSLVIDIMSSPYQVFESSPKETIDLFSDEECPLSSTQRRNKDGEDDEVSSGVERAPRSVTGASNVPAIGQKSSSIAYLEETAPSVTSTTHAIASTITSSSGSIFPPNPSLPHMTFASSVAGGNKMSSIPTTSPCHNDGNFTGVNGEIYVKSAAPTCSTDTSAINSTFHRGPMTPPGDEHETLDLARGPQTPSSDMAPDSYDPFNPTTESPENRINSQKNSNDDLGQKNHNGVRNSDISLSVDMEVDSPCSPG